MKLTECRRSSGDLKLFRHFTKLYDWADDNSKLPDCIFGGLKHYPLLDLAMCDHVFVVSHKSRIELNSFMNHHFAEQHKPVMFLASTGEQKGAAMQPQAMIIWKGAELLCYSRRYKKNSPVTGAVYVVQDFDEKTVTVKLHPDYAGKNVTVDAQKPAEEAEEPTNDGEESDPEELDVEDPGHVSDKRDGDVYVLTKVRAAEILRLQHALVYASIQGRTFRDKHIGLMDLSNHYLTVRDIITAMSRPTHGKYLHFYDADKQCKILKLCATVNGEALKQQARGINDAPESERRTPSRVGR